MDEIKIKVNEILKEDEKLYNQKYYKTNKQKILQHMKQKVICDCCNKSVNKAHLNRHMNTKFCQMVKNKNDMIVNKENVDVEDLKLQLEEIKQKLAKLDL